MSCITYGVYKVYKDPIAYSQSDVYSYMYVDVKDISLAIDNYYFASDDEYIYIYHNRNDVSSLTRLTGIPVKLKEKDFKRLLPLFQEKYPQLKIENIDDMKDYVGLYALQETLFPLVLPMLIALAIDILLLIGIFYILIRMIYHSYQTNRCFKAVSSETLLLQQIESPLMEFPTLQSIILEDYLIVHRPFLYAMKYDDIEWAYIEKKSFLFLFNTKFKLIVYDKNHKKTTIIIFSGLSNKAKQDLYLLINQISLMNSKIMIGFTKKNKKQYQEKKAGVIV